MDTTVKKILVIFYSQSGQLKKIAENFTAPFTEAGFVVEMTEIKPLKAFPFPWTGREFFQAMPESVLGIPAEIQAPETTTQRFDLVIFAYQPWFLSPSIPATSALHHAGFASILKDTPVVTLIGARNMWIMAQEKVKSLLKRAGANLVGNVVFKDRNPNLISAVTIQHWLYTGKKDKWLGIFPKPGISDEDIQSAGKYGQTVCHALQHNTLKNVQDAIVSSGGVEIIRNLLFVESRGSLIFTKWAEIIIKKKNRSVWLTVFKYYLLFAIFVISPILLLIYMLFIAPFTRTSYKRRRDYFLSVNYH